MLNSLGTKYIFSFRLYLAKRRSETFIGFAKWQCHANIKVGISPALFSPFDLSNVIVLRGI